MDGEGPSDEVTMGRHQQKPPKKRGLRLREEHSKRSKVLLTESIHPSRQGQRWEHTESSLWVLVLSTGCSRGSLAAAAPQQWHPQNGTGRDSAELAPCSAGGWQCARAHTKPGSKAEDSKGNSETCFLVTSGLVSAFGKTGCFGTSRGFHFPSRILFSLSVQNIPSRNDAFWINHGWLLHCHSQVLFSMALFLGTSKLHCPQSLFVLVFAFWPIPVACSFSHAFPHQIDFSGSPT